MQVSQNCSRIYHWLILTADEFKKERMYGFIDYKDLAILARTDKIIYKTIRTLWPSILCGLMHDQERELLKVIKTLTPENAEIICGECYSNKLDQDKMFNYHGPKDAYWYIRFSEEFSLFYLHLLGCLAGQTGHIELLSNLFQSRDGWGTMMIDTRTGNWTRIAVDAARYGHHKIIGELVKTGIDLEELGFAPFGCFTEIMRVEGGKEILEVILKVLETTEATIDYRRWWNVDSLEDLLIEAINRQNEKAVDRLIAAGADFTRQTPTPLMEAARRGYREIVRKFIVAGALIETRYNGYTPMIRVNFFFLNWNIS